MSLVKKPRWMRSRRIKIPMSKSHFDEPTRVFDDTAIQDCREFLTFGFCDQIEQSYTPKTKYRSLPYKKYIHRLKKQSVRNAESFTVRPFKKYAYVTSRVKRGPLPGFDKYLMILDTDGEEDKNKAVAWLDKKGIRSFLINSSPSKYWIICDKIDTVANLTHMMDEIPGVDGRFTDCCRGQGVLVYRGFPKPGFIPRFDDISEFTGMGLFEKWVLNFKEYWETEDMEEISANLFMEAI